MENKQTDNASLDKKEINFTNTLSKKNTIILSILTFVFSIIFYFGLINNGELSFGISIFLLELLFIFVNFNFFGKDVKIKKNYNLIIGIVLALLVSFWYIIYTNDFFTISFLFILFFLNSFIVFHTLNKKFPIFGNIQNYIGNIFEVVGKTFNILPFSIKELKNSYFPKKGVISNKENVESFFIGFWILSIILLIILPLLASADKVFANFLNDFISIFTDSNFLQSIINSGFLGDLFFILIIFFLFFTLFLYIPTHKVILTEEKNKEYVYINKIISFIVINGLNIVYFLFVLIQFRYIFFGSQELFKSLNITYAEYIHQGFYQLIIVAIINFLIYKFFHKRISTKEKFEKISLLLLLIFTIIISYSALTRIFLYIDAYNLTILRFFVVYICVLIIALFLVNIYTLYYENEKANKYFYYFVLMSFIFIGYFNIEAYVAKYNINHYKQSISKHLDKNYIKSLGYDAIDEKKLIFPEKELKKEVKMTTFESLLNYNYYFNKNVIKK